MEVLLNGKLVKIILSISFKKEKAHESNIRQIITINQFIVTCSDDHSINIW